ncbi:hypothetical protein FHG87_005184 [Trinorchestia longiramus]|nr:hypothetical protein FHG87_005184 [Trinorchestia longiramus]
MNHDVDCSFNFSVALKKNASAKVAEKKQPRPYSSSSPSPPLLPPPIITITSTNNNNNSHHSHQELRYQFQPQQHQQQQHQQQQHQQQQQLKHHQHQQHHHSKTLYQQHHNHHHYHQQQQHHQQRLQKHGSQAPAPKRKQYRNSPSSSSNATNTPTPTPSSPSSLSTTSTPTPSPSNLTNSPLIGDTTPEPLVQVDFRTPSPSSATPTLLNPSSSQQNLSASSPLSFNSQSPLNITPSPRSLSTSPLQSSLSPLPPQTPSPAPLDSQGRRDNPLSPLNFNNVSPLTVNISPIHTPLLSPLQLAHYDLKQPLDVDISPLSIDPPQSLQSSSGSLELSQIGTLKSREKRGLTSSIPSIPEHQSVSSLNELQSQNRASSGTMNLEHPSILKHRGDGGTSGGGRSSGVSSRTSGNFTASGNYSPAGNFSSCVTFPAPGSIMTNRPSSRTSSRASNVPNSTQSNRSSSSLSSPRKLSRTLSGSGHLTRPERSASNIPSLSGNIASNLSTNFGGNLSGNLGGGNLSNTSTAGSGDEELDLDELLRLNIPTSGRRNVDHSLEELCGGRQSYGGGGGGGNKGCNLNLLENTKMGKLDPISTITGRMTPLSDSATNLYKSCNISKPSKSAMIMNNSSYSSKHTINHPTHYSSSTSIHKNPYSSNPNIAHNPYASHHSISGGYNSNTSGGGGGGKNNSDCHNPSNRSGSSRRGILQRSDTAPEELVFERNMSGKMEHTSSEWRRKRHSFTRASSAERPSSVSHSKGSSTQYNSGQAEYAGEC